jgi:hypothetical protein
MSASEGKGGASPLVWTLIGIVLGIASGWWYGALIDYTILGGILGWLVGLSLKDAGTGAGEH